MDMTAKPVKRVKHVPQRTCVGCRTVLAKRQLIRVVRTAEGCWWIRPVSWLAAGLTCMTAVSVGNAACEGPCPMP
jgi:hypothetical protein